MIPMVSQPGSRRGRRTKIIFIFSKQRSRHLFFGFWLPAKAKVITLLIFWLPAEAKSYHSLFFDSLQKQSHHHLNLLICWSSAHARSQLFSRPPTKARSKVMIIRWHVEPQQKQGHICLGTWSPAEARSRPFSNYLFVCGRTQSRNHTSLFSIWRYVTLSAWPRSQPHFYQTSFYL